MVQGGRDRNRSERERAPDVRHHEDRPARQPVDPDAGRQAEEQERKEVDRSERRDLERRRVQRQDGDERQRDARDLRAELTDALSRPQLQKVGMPPQAAMRPDPYAGHYCARAGDGLDPELYHRPLFGTGGGLVVAGCVAELELRVG